MKKAGYSVEIVTEYVKAWAYLNRNIQKYDQVYLNARQMHDEYRFLSNGVQTIITDSPPSLSCVYTKKFSPDLSKAIMEINRQYDIEIPPLNFYINRKDKAYNPEGRWQSYAEAIEKDREVKEFLEENYSGNYHEIDYGDVDAIFSIIKDKIK